MVKAMSLKRNSYELIIGSSNLTQDALGKNAEYNLKVYAKNESKIINDALNLFNKNFKKGKTLTNELIDEYEKSYKENFKPRIKFDIQEDGDQIEYSPNEMQRLALDNINKLRSLDQNKALLISATATGKTFLSAFDVEQMKANKVLFIVHRLNIARKSLKLLNTYSKIKKHMGYLVDLKKI